MEEAWVESRDLAVHRDSLAFRLALCSSVRIGSRARSGGQKGDAMAGMDALATSAQSSRIMSQRSRLTGKGCQPLPGVSRCKMLKIHGPNAKRVSRICVAKSALHLIEELP